MSRSNRSQAKSCEGCRFFEATGLASGYCNNPEIPLKKTGSGDVCSMHKAK